LWEDIPTLAGIEVYFIYHVYNPAIVVPESIDAIRGLTDSQPDSHASNTEMDDAQGITRDLFRKLPRSPKFGQEFN
jgi:glyceraldehyde-3-phosphate dehydrogenase (NAD(P))